MQWPLMQRPRPLLRRLRRLLLLRRLHRHRRQLFRLRHLPQSLRLLWPLRPQR